MVSAGEHRVGFQMPTNDKQAQQPAKWVPHLLIAKVTSAGRSLRWRVRLASRLRQPSEAHAQGDRNQLRSSQAVGLPGN